MFDTPSKPSPPSKFKSNFSFISDKTAFATKSQMNIEEAQVFRSSDRATIQPKISTLEEIEKINFPSRKNSVFCPRKSGENLCQSSPRILKQLLRFERLVDPIMLKGSYCFSDNISENQILQSLIFLLMEMLEDNITQGLCLNELWNLVSKHLFYDKPVQFINTLEFLINHKQKLIVWVLIKFYEHRLADLVSLQLSEQELRPFLKKNCKLKAFEKEFLEVLSKIDAKEYSLNSHFCVKYEEFLNEPGSFSFSVNFSRYIKNSSVKFKNSLREDDPIKLWKQKSKTLNFSEFQEKLLRKETQEIEELIQDSDFLSNFMKKYYKDAPSPRNIFENQLKKHKLFLENLIENIKYPENAVELLESRENFLKDFFLVKIDLTQRLEEVKYLKAHTYPNDYQKEEEKICSTLNHLEYLFYFLDQIFNGVKPQDFFSGSSPQGLELEAWDFDEKNLGIINLDYNRTDLQTGMSPWSSLTPEHVPRLINSKSNPVNLKTKRRSEKLYQERFSKHKDSDILRMIKEKPLETTISEQRNQCYSCRQNITQGLYFFGNNTAFCYYTGHWYCLDCMSTEERVIPYKVIEEFDFTEYSVSEESRQEIDELFQKCVVNLPYSSALILKCQKLYEFMVLKREIHLIYNMICDEKLVESLLQDKINLALKENMFSLQNLCDIESGTLTRLLEKCIKYLLLHFDSCQICQKRGVQCVICKSLLKIYAFDLLNTEFCIVCKRLYHSKCLKIADCVVCGIVSKSQK